MATFLSSSDFQYTQKTTRYFARDWNNKQAWILVPFYDPAPATTTFSVAALQKLKHQPQFPFPFWCLLKTKHADCDILFITLI